MMKGLSPLLSTLASGTLRVDTAEGSQKFLIEGGFAHVDGENLTLVTEGAIRAEDLNLEEAQAELAAANARITTGMKNRDVIEREQRVAAAKVALAKSNS